ncbi:MAG: hypothetical protein KC933_32310 [Myxococcales bacterium]|nr:hypothetical protein [Myxococcales bacterium]MCB9645432.1 hypothetical protein [Deltaproteobacteria bacterium]
MSERVRGRVLQATSDGVVLGAGGRRRAWRLPGQAAPPVGALVEAAAEGDALLRLEVVFEPRVPLQDALRWWDDAEGPARLELLAAGHQVRRALRGYLDREGFVEVPSPLVTRGACPDEHMDSFLTEGGEALVTSTEYQLKRLVVGGLERLYSLTQNFRREQPSERHNPEFTMLEWARAWEDLAAIEADVERFVGAALVAVAGPEATTATWRGHTVTLRGVPWARLTLQEALARHLGIEVSEAYELQEILRGADAAGVELPDGFRGDRAWALSYLLDLLTPHLGRDVPVFIHAWPAFMTSSAEMVPGKPELAVRSELFIAGLEVADGFPFLRDAQVQDALFARELTRRRASGKTPVPVDHAYVRALAEGLPPGAGMALGVDRLIMILTGADSIRQVLPFAWDEL